MKKFFIYAIALAGSISINNKVQSQQGFSVSVKAAPQFSFMQNKSDNDNNSYNRKVYSFTSSINTKSEKVMQKIDMIKKGEFNHPDIPLNSALCRHVVYKTDK